MLFWPELLPKGYETAHFLLLLWQAVQVKSETSDQTAFLGLERLGVMRRHPIGFKQQMDTRPCWGK